MTNILNLRNLFVVSAAMVLSSSVGASVAFASDVTRSFGTLTPVAGSDLPVSLTVSVTPPDTTPPNDFYLVDEVVPIGWIVTAATNGGDFTSQIGHVKWAVLSGATSVINEYTVTVPVDAIGVNTFSGEFAFGSTPTPLSILGDTDVDVQAVVPDPTSILTTINVTPALATIDPGATISLTADVLDQNGAPFAGATMTWTSSDTAIADVDATGLVIAGAADGVVTITATATDGVIEVIGTAEITVSTPVPGLILTSVGIAPATASIETGATVQLTASPLDQNAAPIAATVTWTSSDTAIATVDATGLVTGVSAGLATITASATDGVVTVTGTSALTVTAVVPPPPADPVLTSVVVSPAATALATGASQQLSASPLNQNGAIFIGASVIWSSSDTAIATVDATGLVAGVSAGTATITASAVSGVTTVTGTAAVTVLSPSASTVSRSFSATTLGAGSDLIVSLAVSVLPPNDIAPNDFYIIDEVVPVGWTVTAATNAGDFTSQAGHVKWVVTGGAVSVTHTYTATAPAAGVATFSGEFGFGPTAPLQILGSTVVTVVPPLSGNQQLPAADVTLNPTQSQVVIVSSYTSPTTISVPASVTNGSLDFSSLLAGSSVTLPGSITVLSSVLGGDLRIEFPSAAVLTASGTWSGILSLPTATTTSAGPTPTSGNTVTMTSIIEVGFGDTPVTFSVPVKMTFVGQAGKLVGWSQAGVFHEVSAVCDSLTAPTLTDGADCKIDSGFDLIVWTRHFSTFITYAQTPIPAPAPAVVSSGGGGRGGGGRTVFASNTTTSAAVSSNSGPSQGQVLGAATFFFSKSMSIGSQGDEVRTLQQFLIDEGYAIPAGATGYYGAQTRAAVVAFQRARGIAQVGIVGPLTRAELNKGRGSVSSGTSSSGRGSGLSAAQVGSIITVLQSFGVDEATLARVRSILG